MDMNVYIITGCHSTCWDVHIFLLTKQSIHSNSVFNNIILSSAFSVKSIFLNVIYFSEENR